MRVGVNLSTSEPANTAAVILDSNRESHFLLQKPLSQQTLVNFILNYTNGLLERYFKQIVFLTLYFKYENNFNIYADINIFFSDIS